MKEKLFVSQGGGFTKVLTLFVIFFFVGSANVNAQYVSSADAVNRTKKEVSYLSVAFNDATTAEEKNDIYLKMEYYRILSSKLKVTNADIQNAIETSFPRYKPQVVEHEGNVLVSYDVNGKLTVSEKNALITDAEILLQE